MTTPDRLHPAPFVAGLAGAITVTLVGVWLVVAPFAVGYQPEGADWVDATIIGVATGAGVIVLGLLALLVVAGALRAEIRRRGLAPTGRPRSEDDGQAVDADVDDDPVPAAAAGDLDTILASLATALLEDVRATDPAPDPAPTTATHASAPPADLRRRDA